MTTRLDRELRESVGHALFVAQLRAAIFPSPKGPPCTCINSCLTQLQACIAYGVRHLVRTYFDRSVVDIEQQTRCGRSLVELAEIGGNAEVLATVLARVSGVEISRGLSADSMADYPQLRRSSEPGVL